MLPSVPFLAGMGADSPDASSRTWLGRAGTNGPQAIWVTDVLRRDHVQELDAAGTPRRLISSSSWRAILRPVDAEASPR